MKIAIGSDHAGFEMKESIINFLRNNNYDIVDFGTYSKESTNYAKYGIMVGEAVVNKQADFGIVICFSGVGISIASNKVRGVRAGLCVNTIDANLIREHNNANVLALGANKTDLETANEIVKVFLTTPFAGGRHQNRINTITDYEDSKLNDVEVFNLIDKELFRQRTHLELIASENIVSRDVLKAQGSILTNKYAEGYPGKRYYGGCEEIDKIETLAIERAKKLFGAEHANVQAHSGTQANMVVYAAILNFGDTVLGMDLKAGGHLSHGSSVSFSGLNYHFISYGLDPISEEIDYNAVEEIALKERPKLIVAGASSYSRIIDFKRFREIADKIGAYLMVDMAHIAGLVAVGLHPSPVPYADFVTSTTHKTLRGPRGGLILCKEKYANLLDKKVFPGIQGGPLEHVIAAKAVCFKEASTVEYFEYITQVLKNIKALEKSLKEEGFRIVSNGSDNHLLMVDLRNTSTLNGKEAEDLLNQIGITTNKNAIPFDPQPPSKCSGIRLGTASLTTRGFKEREIEKVGKWISLVLKNPTNQEILRQVKEEIETVLVQFPIY
ncbi:MAG: ribose 5-phosphate isomerase B [Bacillales bacterium]|nr:ribose 5-phosphate isomerase B [Bacillales bacterium]